MYIANNTEQRINDIIAYLPYSLRRYFYETDISDAYEIHLSPGRPVSIYYPGARKFLSHSGLTDNPYQALRVRTSHIDEAMELISKSSVYSVEDEIRNGFITIEGGNRIGLCGSAVIRDGRVVFVKEISALNYRIAREIKGVSDAVIESVLKNGQARNTLIISPPGAGKTTMLRDIIRRISDMGVRVCVVDERREIAAMHNGKSAFDLGMSTSVFSGAPKAAGMLMMLRAMSPEVIASDEIGTGSDVGAITKIINSGTKIITTIHGYGVEQVRGHKELSRALPYFETFITLSKRNGFPAVEGVIEL